MVTIYTYLIHCQLIGSLIFSSSIALLPFGKSINFVVHQTAFLLLKTLRDKIKHKMFAQNVYRQKIMIKKKKNYDKLVTFLAISL